MGGGEVARYFSRYGGKKIAKVVLVSAVTPFMFKTEGNEEGVDEEVFVNMLAKIKTDRAAFLDDFGKQFFSVGLLNHPVSTPLLEHYRTLAMLASPIATYECAKAFAETDFRQDLLAINVPTLIIHGDDDKTVPIEASSNRTAQLVKNNAYLVYGSAPHGLFFTHKEELNNDLLAFINGEIKPGDVELHNQVVLPSNYPL
jgi:pimeloyl-ACP methyl ester carboxylesterase